MSTAPTSQTLDSPTLDLWLHHEQACEAQLVHGRILNATYGIEDFRAVAQESDDLQQAEGIQDVDGAFQARPSRAHEQCVRYHRKEGRDESDHDRCQIELEVKDCHAIALV